MEISRTLKEYSSKERMKFSFLSSFRYIIEEQRKKALEKSEDALQNAIEQIKCLKTYAPFAQKREFKQATNYYYNGYLLLQSKNRKKNQRKNRKNYYTIFLSRINRRNITSELQNNKQLIVKIKVKKLEENAYYRRAQWPPAGTVTSRKRQDTEQRLCCTGRVDSLPVSDEMIGTLRSKPQQ
ncbi:hypothetical protein M9H77_08452 [Catharanthus roseus]|uniref:Uncharacterized protein n=1 Tax=Catharanthus roseus TaxID=4058 RepID=A0ACC0BY15_CATRO|nr:hypothetical protein M9H77_08452 [Catharanthus roseus]